MNATQRDDLIYLLTEFEARHDFGLHNRVVVASLAGSTAYDTRTADSDTDYTIVAIPRMRHVLGFGDFGVWHPEKEGLARNVDVTVTSVRRFIELALDGNPNVIETLFFRPEMFLMSSPAWENLLHHRDIFLSKHVYKRFVKYAEACLKKMTLGLTSEKMGAKRKAAVAQHGYDPKDASRLIHLLYTGFHLANLGQLVPHVEGTWRDVIVEIKEGRVPLDWVKQHAERFFALCEAAYEHCKLPDEPDREFAEMLLMDIHREALR